MSSRRPLTTGLALASISVAALMAGATAASAQAYPYGAPQQGYYQGSQQGYYQSQPGGPDQQGYYQGQQGYYQQQPPQDYPQRPPQPGYRYPPNYNGYDPRAQQYDDQYASRYSAWAAQYCVERRNQNTAAGAVIGGVLGALVGSGAAGHHERVEGAVVGGALGATAGAAIGSSTTNPEGCPPGYVVAEGAPAFYYGGPYVGAVVEVPGGYNPWYRTGGHWYYRPYRQYYWQQHGWHGGRYEHHWH